MRLFGRGPRPPRVRLVMPGGEERSVLVAYSGRDGQGMHVFSVLTPIPLDFLRIDIDRLPRRVVLRYQLERR